ncbi:MAG: ABC transporter ATP-binding protein [Leptolinea sp.]|jgi:putative ABC transport system ATP-binding protein|nr:ABC transporter ATP-binding protein [Leptolinea sp.]
MRYGFLNNLAVNRALVFPNKSIHHTDGITDGQVKAANHTELSTIVTLENVIKTYETPAGEFQALKNISIDIHANEFLCIVGKSGAGKTTLLNMITGVDAITAGNVNVNGVSVHNMNEDEQALWRGLNLGIIYQSFELMPMLTLLENVMLPMDFCHKYVPIKSRERARELLRMVELEDHIDKLPGAISGGQQQRVAIARALANDPPVIVADEPTGRLDSTTAETILDIFEKLIKEGKTVIMVTHDAGASQRASRVLEIVDGELLAENNSTITIESMIGTKQA